MKTTWRFIFVGIAFAAFYWIGESVAMAYVFHFDSFVNELLYPNSHELWMRVPAILLIFASSIYAQYSITKQRLVITDLNMALSKVNTLSGLLPICAWCKKLRNDEGYWKSVEEYISEHTGAEFTHGMCPECYDKVISEGDSKRRVGNNAYQN